MIGIHTLGTGSGKPTPERNVASTALFRNGALVLFDCGEGTQMQITRSNLRPGSIRIICISHFHGDHINGLPGLLGTLQMNQRTEPLLLVGPKGIKTYIQTLSRLGVIGLGYPLEIREITEPGILYEGEEITLAADRLKHRITSWGFRVTERDRPGRFDVARARALEVPEGPLFGRLQRGETVEGRDGRVVTPDMVLGPVRRGLAVAYCSDTQPCPGSIRLAAGADMLIHEGTYAPGEETIAHRRGHSTMADAARIAQQAGVGELVITHISQKYVRTNAFLKSVCKIFPATRIAEDLDTFDLKYDEA